MPENVKVKMPADVFSDLASYLKEHEQDIKNKENDFGQLHFAFYFFFDREPGSE